MPTSTRLDDLVHRCEKARRRGEPVDPGEVCRDCPELLEPLRRALAALRQVDGLLGTVRPADATLTPDPPPASTPPGLPDAPLQPGAEPVHGYRLVRRLGAGGFGEVWQAEGPGGFPAALKFVRMAGRAAAGELRSLEIVKRLRHPNLLATFAAWAGEGRVVIAMELADRTLGDRLEEARAGGLPGIPRDELMGYMSEAAKGLDFLNEPHRFEGEPDEVRVQHRDVKPANILLVGGGVKVADFGLARLLARTATGHSGGLSPAYAAPEFFQAKTSQHSDQYSLAVSYCELRGGRLPYGGTPAEAMVGHLMEPPDLGMLPDGERAAVARAMAKKPEDRWPSCRAFVQALTNSPVTPTEPWRPPEPPRTIPAPPARPAEQTRLRSWAAPLIGVALFGLVAAAGLLWPFTGPTQPSKPETIHSARKGSELVAGKQKLATEEKQQRPKEDAEVTSIVPTRTSGPPAIPPSPLVTFTGHAGPVRCLAWVPGERKLVLSGGDDKVVRLWDPETGTDVRSFPGHTGTVHCLSVSRDGRRALSGGDDMTVRLWNLETGGGEVLVLTLPEGFRGEVGEVYGVAFRGDDQEAVSVGNEQFVRLWDLRRRRMATAFPTPDREILSMALTPDGRHLLTGGKGGKLRRWDVATHKQVDEYKGHTDDVMSIAVFPGTDRFVSAGGGNGPDPKGSQDYTVRVWEADPARAPHELAGHKARVVSVAVSPDGRNVLSAGADGMVLLWRVDPAGWVGPGRPVPYLRGDTKLVGVTCAAFAPDNRHILTAHADTVVRVWQLPEAVLEPPVHPSPDGVRK